MNFDVVLRAASPDFDVRTFLGRYPQLEPDAVWTRGSRTEGGRRATSSGFNLSLGAGADWKEVWPRARQRLVQLSDAVEELWSQRVTCSLDVGVFADARQHFALSPRFSVDDLTLLAKLGLELEVSAYPAPEADEGD